MINDYIFARMIDPDWSALERAFVDKATAKDAAQHLVPSLRVAETLQVIPQRDLGSVESLYEALLPYSGRDAIAKPAHASGAATFLKNLREPAQVEMLQRLASVDYATVLREMQYHHLPRKVIVEALIPSFAGQPPDDYKFHCVRGEPLVCQVDHNRFGSSWSRLLTVPEFSAFDHDDGLSEPPSYHRPDPDRIAALIDAAGKLSAPFEFVRVDLYDGEHGIYFGELTFSPAASLGIAPSGQGDATVNPTHVKYSRLMMSTLND